MKNIILITIGLAVLQSCHSKDQKEPQAPKQKIALMETSNKTSFTCKLTTPELQKRKETAIKAIKNIILAKEELSDGYSYKFDGSDHTIDLLSEFIKTERQCCDFFNFNIGVKNDNSIVLQITGAEGVKGFIAAELEM